MLRYLLKTLLQMNLFSDTIRNSPNGTEPFFNGSLPSFNSSLLDWGNLTGFNGKRRFRASLSFRLPSPPRFEPALLLEERTSSSRVAVSSDNEELGR